LIVGKAAPALKEMRRGASPNIPESHVCKTLQQHSRNGVGWIDLSHVASGRDQLRNKVAEEREKGNQIIIFDAETRRDLKNIVEVAFRSERIPLFVGSAGLAEEVAKRLAPRTGRTVRRTKAFKHILIVSGTTSKVTHQQLDRLERQKATSFQLNPSLILGDTSDAEKGIRELSMKVGNSLPQGVTILRTPTDTLASQNSKERSIRLRILKTLASLALRALDESNIANHDLVLILTGGETAQNVIKGLEPQGIELEAELLNGIAKGRLIGGKWDGLTVVTKAGAFGQEDALETVVRMIKTGAP
jgi:uncharacterized protein YgbK (DUF1537 family)